MTELKPAAVREYSIALVRRSWWYYVRSLLAGAVLVGLGLYLIYKGPNTSRFGLGLLVVGLLTWAIIPIARRSISWLITSDRLIEECGILSTRRRQLELQDIRSIEVTRSFLQRLTGLGNVVIASAASAEYLISLSDVHDPDGVAETVRKARLRRLG